jgi:hypothetical protein
MLPTSQRTAAFSLRVLVLGVLASIATTGCDIVTADLRHAATSEWRKSYTLEPGGRLEVSNVNGRIQVEASEGNQVEIVAQKKARGISEDAAKEAADRVEIKETVSSSSIRIETRMPQTSGMFRGSAEVSYSVRVPSGADVKLTTVNGGIDLSRLTGKIDVETTNGGIVAREVGGAIQASTTNGGVEVELTQVASGGVKLGCVNGGIKLRLPSEAAATISASVANGGIDADGLKLETTDSSRRSLEARLNGRTDDQDRRYERRDQARRALTSPVGNNELRSARAAAGLSGEPSLQQSENGRFSLRERAGALRHSSGSLRHRLDQRAVKVGFQDRRVDVALPADRLRISKPLCHRFHGLDDVAFGLGVRFEGFEVFE